MRALIAAMAVMCAATVTAQTKPPSPPAPSPPPARGSAPVDSKDTVTPAQLAAAIDKLGTVEFSDRMAAARTTRRAEPGMAVPALLKAVDSHPDSFVRFRALVLLSGFNDPRTRDIMRASLSLKNDRLRAVAYTYFEHHPDPAVVPTLLGALATEA
ncbi:MAG: HEAT repeat domain-containing protein, partial [Vicinamibacterales bacterium]